MKITLKLIALAVLLVFLPINQAWAAQIMVKPMRVQAPVRAGTKIRIPIEVRNNASGEEGPIIVDVIMTDLHQKEDGLFDAVLKSVEGVPMPETSARKWLTLVTKEMTIAPMEIGTVKLEGLVPSDARGFYFAALLVQERPREGQTINLAFMIPVILEIDGRPVKQQVNLKDVSMAHIKGAPGTPATTNVGLAFENTGRTFPRIKGRVQIFSNRADRRVLVSNAEVRELSVMPGVNLNLAADIERRLPSGKYELEGEIFVDGRRQPPLKKEIEFEGDPDVQILAVDTSLILDPPELFITSVPGAMRTSTIALENASSETVEITTASAIPGNLRGVAIGNVTGDQLSCADWIRISPPKFSIKGGAKQNVRVVTQIPKERTEFPNYYGLLQLTAKYPDGQSAGETKSLVCLSNKTAETVYKSQIINLALAADAEMKYLVKAQLANTGNIHFIPALTSKLDTAQGYKVTETNLTGESSLMLPMEVRDFTGEVDFAEVKPGDYRLVTTIQMTKDLMFEQTTPVQVKEEDGRKIVTTLQTPETDEPPKQ